MARWGKWRNDEFAEPCWLAGDLGSRKPSEVLTPRRLVRATGRAVARGGDRLAKLREVASLAGDDMRRRRLKRKPAYGQRCFGARRANAPAALLAS